ncbi:MAG: hypothetical protein KF784_00145 [Fimbriimonadaceae bacterium]|nr:hypothetical protein [Fimbriimonadaceae bacterium]
MKNLFTILVVEHSEIRYAAFQSMLETARAGLPIKIISECVTSSNAVSPRLTGAEVVITNACMSDDKGTIDAHHGRAVVKSSLNANKPVVWYTTEDPQEEGLKAHVKWGRDHGLEMFVCASTSTHDESLRAWKLVMFGAIALSMGIKSGMYLIDDCKIWGHHPSDPRFQRSSRITSRYARLGDRDLLGASLNQATKEFLEPSPLHLELLRMGLGRDF